ncbi:hypothetical protein VTK73DRAFT_6791 [Phialemonium thermophilum]|uniref:Uncharacterized protein n=1 Tax=Phialemonium thermophilum TaxID=223376 RepID=A0ABR3Y8F5_9PEZI
MRSRFVLSARRASAQAFVVQRMRYASSARRTKLSTGRVLGLFSVAVLSGVGLLAYPILTQREPVKPQRAEIEFEPSGRQMTKEDSTLLNSQVRKSWERPGVYAWGSNAGRVAAPDSDEAVIKTARRIPFFDGQLLRDLKLDRHFGAAVTEGGDLVQWGTGYSKTSASPTVTLRGKDLVKIALSKDRIIALSSNGSVYSLPVAAADQAAGEKQSNASWLPFWSSPASISYRSIKPNGLRRGEKIVDISSGLEHCLMLTSKGRVFSAASSTEDFPSKGQLGIPGLSWETRPQGPYDEPHEVAGLRGFDITQIATGDYHSLALDRNGNVFSFGDNSAGQLGFEPDPESPHIDVPSPLPFKILYRGSGLLPRVTSVAAGGLNSFFTVAAAEAPTETGNRLQGPHSASRGVIADTWACGEGIHGSLGTGKWTHISNAPSKIKALSNLAEYDEKTKQVVPIGLSRISAGSTHVCAVLDNSTNTSAGRSSDSRETWGNDVLFWGGNEHYQLGTGRRNNVPTPVHIGALDGSDDVGMRAKGAEFLRFQVAPRTTTRLGEEGKGRKATVEQRVECGRYVTAVYSAT